MFGPAGTSYNEVQRMGNSVRRIAFAVSLLVALSASALAQGVGAIGGTVTDESGAVLPGVTVTLSSPGVIGGNQNVVTDGTGAYQFARLVPGTYSVAAELQGFRRMVVEGVRVSADTTSRADLKLALGEVAETITVAGTAPLLDTTSALNQTVMSREVLDTVATARDLFSIARLAPALTVGKLDVGGKDSLMNSNNVFIHGSWLLSPSASLSGGGGWSIRPQGRDASADRLVGMLGAFACHPCCGE